MDTERRRAVWYFDFISPFAYLQWRALDSLAPILTFEFRPILLAALLDHHGHKGPAEIAQKRRFTYRFAAWRAQRAGIPLRFPPAHPFNPLPALRLALALGCRAGAIDAIFSHLWVEGRAGDSPAALAPVAARFGIEDVERALADPAAKAALRANTEAAIARGVFGVPTVDVDGELFWGDDATPMLHDWLAHPERFREGELARVLDLPMAARRG